VAGEFPDTPMTKRLLSTAAAAVGTFVLTLLGFIFVMWRVWGLSEENLGYALELGCLWGAIGAGLLTYVTTTVPAPTIVVLKFALPLWLIAACFGFFLHIIRTA